ncbi:MAG: hypothetical protein AAFO75_03865, partial [Pseudomonadota bacterium]
PAAPAADPAAAPAAAPADDMDGTLAAHADGEEASRAVAAALHHRSTRPASLKVSNARTFFWEVTILCWNGLCGSHDAVCRVFLTAAWMA